MRSVAWMAVLLGFWVSACGSPALDRQASTPPPSPSPPPIQQKFLCERSYTNFAWGFQHRGIYVDGQGNVHSYAYRRGEKPWFPGRDAMLTERKLEEKYSHSRKVVGTIDPQELHEKVRLIGVASQGEYSERVQRGADQGGTASLCYLYDAAAQRYRPVELKVEGDWNYENLSPSARELARWLESLGSLGK